MTDPLSRPILAGLAIAGLLAHTGGAAAPERKAEPPSQLPAPGAALSRDLEILHLRAHAAADRLAEWDVGVSDLPPPRRWATR